MRRQQVRRIARSRCTVASSRDARRLLALRVEDKGAVEDEGPAVLVEALAEGPAALVDALASPVGVRPAWKTPCNSCNSTSCMAPTMVQTLYRGMARAPGGTGPRAGRPRSPTPGEWHPRISASLFSSKTPGVDPKWSSWPKMTSIKAVYCPTSSKTSRNVYSKEWNR